MLESFSIVEMMSSFSLYNNFIRQQSDTLGSDRQILMPKMRTRRC